MILVGAVFRKEMALFRRYIFNTLSGVIMIGLVFLALFLGLKMVGRQDLGGTIEGMIVGFYVWTCAIMSYQILSWGIMEEARAGTLEQLYMSPYGLRRVSFCYVLSHFVISIGISIPVLAFMMILTGKYLHIDLPTVLPLLIVTMTAGFGLGYITGGLGLIYKRIQAFFQILQFVFIGFISLPVDRSPLFKFLPFTLGSHLISDNMIRDVPLWGMDPLDLLILALASGFYLVLGIVVFGLCERKARTDGTMGHY
jgi:ABC-2 type transport system permease protein